MSKYYFITKQIFHDGTLIPKIPQESNSVTIPRVRVSSSIAGALTMLIEEDQCLDTYLEDSGGTLRVLEIDLSKQNIPRKSILSSQYLYENNLVPNAHHTDEVWITTPVMIPTKQQYLIQPKTWHEETVDVIPYFVNEHAKIHYNKDIKSAYVDLMKNDIPDSIKICNLTFKKIHN